MPESIVRITTPMNQQIDTKSALLGLCVGITAMLALGASSHTSTSGHPGRFQIVTSSNHGLVIDTATGKVWRTFLRDSIHSDGNFWEAKAGEPK